MMCIFDCRLPGSSLDRDFIAYGEAKKFVLVKGTSCFIYGEEHDPSPLYAIPLEDVYAVLEDPDAPDPMSVTVNPRPSDHKPRDGMVTVLLKYRSDGSQAYQVTFDTSSDRTLAKRFIDILDHVNAKKGGDVGASVVYAELVGQEAKKAQPDI